MEGILAVDRDRGDSLARILLSNSLNCDKIRVNSRALRVRLEDIGWIVHGWLVLSTSFTSDCSLPVSEARARLDSWHVEVK
jgi:hypothetical protein